MKMRLFWVMLGIFMLVIVLGVGGMLVLFRVAANINWSDYDYSPEITKERLAFAQVFTNYYLVHNQSWGDIQQHMEELSLANGPGGPTFALTDSTGKIIASTDRRWKVGRVVDKKEHDDGIPIYVNKAQVGTMFMREWRPDSRFGRDRHAPIRDQVVQSLLTGLIVAGVGLSIILFILAIISARHLNRPLRNLALAAQELASGNLNVQVAGSRVRELDELARTFNTMARSLLQADQQRRQMTADIAHELRTPLTIIKGRLEGIQDGIYHATPAQIEKLLEDTALLERLIEDLRLLALAEHGQLPLSFVQENPRDLLEEVAASFAQQTMAKGIHLVVEVPNDLPDINIDFQRMTQVLSNLITNAIRHTPEGGSIVLHGEQYHDHANGYKSGVLICVQDSGEGIAPEDVEHIFDRFWRADQARTRTSGGSGLGLAIARQIVVAHGGTISAESTRGSGTTMRIILPGVRV